MRSPQGGPRRPRKEGSKDPTEEKEDWRIITTSRVLSYQREGQKRETLRTDATDSRTTEIYNRHSALEGG